VRGTDYVCSSL